MSDFFQDVFNKTKKFANNAVDETKDAAQKAKLNNKISNEVQMIDRNMVEIGKYFYEQNKKDPPQELLQYFNNVKVLQDSIASTYCCFIKLIKLSLNPFGIKYKIVSSILPVKWA